MTIQRMEHVGIVVDDLAAATEFFVLGLVLQGEGPSKVAGWTATWGSRAYGRTLRSCKLRTATDDSS
jgi:catechol 2,3-dioxygenase-like lactoylglutathione lyase family enzyme